MPQLRRWRWLAPLLVAQVLHAQAAATVPPSSTVYDQLESISAYYPVRGLFLGERSLSRRQIERSVARLMAAVDSGKEERGSARREWARREVADVQEALGIGDSARQSSRTTATWSWRGDASTGNAQTRRITQNGLGSIDAVTEPFEARRDGWPLVDGASTNIAPTGLISVGDRLAVGAELLWSQTRVRNGADANTFALHRAYARATFHNAALRVGSDEMLWGQSWTSPLFISGNASPFPALMVGTDTAVTLPWLFRLAGPTRGTLFVADLGRSQDPPHAKLAGWQTSIEPWTRFELGVSVLSQMGGSGAPKASFLDRILDLFPVIDALSPAHSDFQFSNKLAGGNLRLRFPELSGLDLYYELQIDDFDLRRFRSSMIEDSGHLLGARLPIQTDHGQFVWRGELHRTSLRLYEHAQFRSGVTYQERIIGDPLGPNAKGAYLTATWTYTPVNSVEVALADEERDPSRYHVTVSDTRDRGFRFVLDSVIPHYRTRRALASTEHALGFGAVRLTLGYDRAWRSAGTGRNEWLGLVSFRSQRLRTF